MEQGNIYNLHFRGKAIDHVALISYFKLNENCGNYLYNYATNQTISPFIYS